VNYNRELLFGRWYRNDIDEQGNEIVEYADLAADGRFEFTFITLTNALINTLIKSDLVTERSAEQIIEQVVELGDWGLVGDIHFTITKNEVVDEQLYAADLNDSNNYHAYKVLQLNHHIFKYQHIESNEIFDMRKVIDKIGHC